MGGTSQTGKARFNTFEVIRAEFASLLGKAWPDHSPTFDADTESDPVPGGAKDFRTLRDLYDAVHALAEEDKPTALCLSGGGIRSATFCLGALQSLAETRQLTHFTYLSTVSGGGYIGSWLSRWAASDDWDKVELALDPKNQRAAERSGLPAPEGTIDEAEADPLRRLRAYSNYLSPIWGVSLDGVTLVAIFLRNLTLNWLVWLPLIAGLVAVPRAYVATLQQHHDAQWPGWLGLFVASLILSIGVGYIVCDLPGPPFDPAKPALQGRFFDWCFKPIEWGANGLDWFARRTRPSIATQAERKSRFFGWCFLPILVCSIILSVCSAWFKDPDTATLMWLAPSSALIYLVGVGGGVLWRVKKRALDRRPLFPLRAAWVVVLCLICGAGLLALVTHYFHIDADSVADDVLLYASFAVPLLLTVFWLTLSLYAGLMRPWTDEQDREWWSRATAWWLFGSVAWVAMFAVVFYLPTWLFDRLNTSIPAGAQVGLGGALLGVITSAFGYWSKNGASLKRKATSVIGTLGMRILDLLALVVLVAIVLAIGVLDGYVIEQAAAWCREGCAVMGANTLAAETAFIRQEAALAALAPSAAQAGVHSSASQAYAHVFTHATFAPMALGLVMLLAFAAGVSVLIGTNTFSLHAMYGNRLVRAYLGTTRAERNAHWFTGFDPDDNCGIAGMLPPRQGGPMQVVNIALNLVQGSATRMSWQQRKAASFIATPLHCGSDGVGYVNSTDYGEKGGMSLGRAMTISGAAASPNMGYHSSKLVAMVMMLFNVRLGWWMPNPNDNVTEWKRSEPQIGLRALLDEGLGNTTDNRQDVYLSDGGHFDNLGIYEMVRRRCHRIVAIDATADPHFAYRDLIDTCRKIRVDFGISIELPSMLPGPGRETADRRRLVARIRYSMRDGNAQTEDGYLVVLKPVLTGDEAPGLLEYARATKRNTDVFPHQSTADQFFDETQFESYRQLGYWSARQSLPADLRLAEDAPTSVDVTDLFAATVVGGAAQPPAAAGGISAANSGLAGLSNLRTATLLATALTVGGTVGVVGTLKVDPTELRFSDADRTLISEGMTLRYTGSPPEDPGVSLGPLLQRTERTLGALITVTQRLGDASEALTTSAEMAAKRSDQVEALVRELRSSVLVLDADFKTFNMQNADDRRRFIETLQKLDARLETLREAGAAPVSVTIPQTQLAQIAGQLDAIRRAIVEVSPRRNIRGE